MSFPAAPPSYRDESAAPLLEENSAPRSLHDTVPDDFKYGAKVIECELSIRQVFLRKVYSLLFAQLTLTMLIGAAIYAFPSVSRWALLNPWASYVCMFLAIGFMIAAFAMSRRYPYNLVFLFLFTLAESYVVGVVSALFDTNIVLEAFTITAFLFIGLTVFAFQTKYDLTSFSGYVFGALWVLIGLGFVMMFFPHSSSMELAYSCFGAFIFSVYVLVDTQMIIRRFSPEEEVPAAISLYLDIVNIFLYVLRIVASTNDNN